MSSVRISDEQTVHPALQLSRRSYVITDFLGRERHALAHQGDRGDKAVLWYLGPGQLFTEEEVNSANANMREENRAAMALIEADGFIRYPLAATNARGEEVEKEAWLHPTFTPSCTEGFLEEHGMETNIYVPSYERAGTAKTIDVFNHFDVRNYYICIDPSQYEKYRAVYPIERLVIRDIAFRDPDMLVPHSSARHSIGMAGHSPLCNFTLALSRSLGEEYFTFADDDFKSLALKAKQVGTLRNGEKYQKDSYYLCTDLRQEYGFSFQEFWHGLEKVAKAVRNPGFVGLERYGTQFSKPLSFVTGTRVYSFYITCNRTQIPHSGRQNNDVITSVELSKNGLVNLLFEGVFYNSAQTQTGGGMTELYESWGTADKGKILVRAQPNTAKLGHRYSRIHHSMDFGTYTSQRVVGAAMADATPVSQHSKTESLATDSYNLFRDHREWTHYFNALRAQDLVQVQRSDGRTDTYAGDSARSFLLRGQGWSRAEIDSMKQTSEDE